MDGGEYLRRRREARGLTLDLVEQGCAAVDPRGNGLLHRLTAYEAGEVPVWLRDAVLLAHVVDFDLSALGGVAAGAPPPICRVCACSEDDPCDDEPFGTCSWAEDDLCSACVGREAA